MPLQYSILTQGDSAFVTVIIPGRDTPLTARNDHGNYKQIIAALTDPDSVDPDITEDDYEFGEYIADLFDVAQAVARKFERLSERVTVVGGHVYLDGEEIETGLTRQIVRFLEAGEDDWKPLVAFFEKVLSNPQQHSRDQLYDWLNQHQFTITDTGDIVAYKGVAPAGDEDGAEWQSISSGREEVLVNDVPHKGFIPNPIGATIEMSRGLVQHDPSVGCHVGLHVGSWVFASSFARGAVLEVHVNPRDVVSVPTDCSWAKVRTCRYRVVQVIDAPYGEAILRGEEDIDGTRYDDAYFTEKVEELESELNAAEGNPLAVPGGATIDADQYNGADFGFTSY